MSIQQVSDPYRALGVARSATEEEIKTAHRTLAKRYHPDSGGGDTVRFLHVQEAYRILSDPLLRREWDARHSPGPVRANRPARGSRPAPAPAAKTANAAKTARAPKSTPKQKPGDQAQSTGSTGRAGAEADPRTQPRSSRAYTWSASEVPWWEDPGSRSDRRPPGRRRPRASASERHETAEADARAEPGSPEEPVFNATQDFEVYNRSSGAAWSMAARAYFRKGDQDLPRRGSFHHQGTQPLTAARARVAAEAEARRRAAAAAAGASASGSAAPAQAAPGEPAAQRKGPARDPRPKSRPEPARARTFDYSAAAPPGAAPAPAAPAPHAAPWPAASIVRQALPVPWPSLGQRLAFALIAWLPIAVLISLGATERTDEVIRAALMALSLGVLIAVPRLAYVASVATLGLLIVAGVLVGAVAFVGPDMPLSTGLMAAFAAALLFGYLATAGLVALGPANLRPWTARGAAPIRNR